MKLSKTLILICIFQFAININAQDYLPIAKTYDGTSIGIGAGQDFGGLGIGVLHYGRNKTVGIFGGLGYTPSGIGINAGLKVRLIPIKINPTFNPFLLGMYGYTTSVSVSNDPLYNKMFYGPTIGIGTDFKLKKTSKGFWSFAMQLPLDNSKAIDYIQYLRVVKQMTFSEPSTFRYSIGYRYLLN
ncbi:MAG: hypothetical protein PHT07_23705 [Paludibacter sp.]|nr:hypothetical protein [Paludibacter sp.]